MRVDRSGIDLGAVRFYIGHFCGQGQVFIVSTQDSLVVQSAVHMKLIETSKLIPLKGSSYKHQYLQIQVQGAQG